MIDWDVSPGDIDDELIRVAKSTHNGRPICDYVAEPIVLRRARLAGTDIEAILRAAEPTDDS